MSDVKTYCFPEGGTFGGNGMEGMLLGSMMNGGMNGGGMWNNPIWAIVFLAALRNGGLFGNDGGNGYHDQLSQIQNTLNTNQGNTLLMDAIKGNSNSLSQLAQTLNCNQNAVTAAINSVQSAICNVGNQLGMGTAQIINSVQAGDTNIITALKDCCCQNKELVQRMGYENQINNLQQSQLIQNGFCQVGYEAAQNSNKAIQAANDNTNRVLAKLDQMEDSRKDREIASLTAALTAATSRAERAAELAPINKALADIQCKQPSVVTVPYQPFVTVPNCVAWQAGLSALGGYPYANGGVFG